MRLVQYTDNTRQLPERVAVLDGETLIDLTSTPNAPTSLFEIYYANGGDQGGLVQACENLIPDGERRALGDLLTNTTDRKRPHLRSSVTPPAGASDQLRVWLAGVTHEDSAKLREIEAKQSTGVDVNVYDQKYREASEGGIPELFAKSDSAGILAHGEAVSRPDSTLRLVPETELVTVYGLRRDGTIDRIGYTGGNDYTDNGIEAQNPLNLPQAKNWSGGCASLGPILVTDDEFDDAEVEVSCSVIRNGASVSSKTGFTGQKHLNMPDGLFHLEKSLFERIPLPPRHLQVLYWGTPIVFSDADLEAGLLDGDVVAMTFANIGNLENPVADWSPPPQLSRLKS